VIFELKTRVDELKMENAYQLRLRDVSYNEKMKDLTEKFVQDMQQLKTKISVCHLDKNIILSTERSDRFTIIVRFRARQIRKLAKNTKIYSLRVYCFCQHCKLKQMDK